MRPFMAFYRRGNSEELTDRMTDRVQSDRCMLDKESIQRRSCAIRSHWQRTFHDLKRVEMAFVPWRSPNALVLNAVCSRGTDQKHYGRDTRSRVYFWR